MYYPIIVDKDDKIRVPKMTYISAKEGYKITEQLNKGEEIVLPIKYENGVLIEKNWQRGYERLQNELSEYRVRRTPEGIKIDFKVRMDESAPPTTWWDDAKYASSNYGALEMKNFFVNPEFSYPKSYQLVQDCIYTAGSVYDDVFILDYFAGSGTTGHSTIDLNRKDNGHRKYLLVEMGKYFDRVTKPKIEKVIYSDVWKESKPVSRKGSSHCFKYIRLESYEDALDNLKMERSDLQSDLLSKPQNKEIKEEYILNYMMDLETQGSLLNVSDFEHPFDYEMKITRDGETKTVKVDLVETFNYLIGLNVESIRKSKEIVAIEGRTRSGEKTLVLWRDTAVVDNKTLDNWFEKQNYSTLDMEFDTIYVNGNNNLENLRKGDETWKVRLTEAEFLKRMFDVKDV